MNSSELKSTAFAAGEESDRGEYRAVSKLAIGALLIGMASPLVLIGPLAAFVPLLGIVVAWVALRELAGSDGELVGRGAALIGLALSVTFLTLAPSRHLAVSWHLHREARPWAERWFELLADDQTHPAHQLTLAGGRRARPDDDLRDLYRNSEQSGAAFRTFLENPLVEELLAVGDRAEVLHWDNITRHSIAGKEYIVQEFAFSYNEEGRKKNVVGRLTLSRTMNKRTGEIDWRVEQFDRVAPSGSEPVGS